MSYTDSRFPIRCRARGSMDAARRRVRVCDRSRKIFPPSYYRDTLPPHGHLKSSSSTLSLHDPRRRSTGPPHGRLAPALVARHALHRAGRARRLPSRLALVQRPARRHRDGVPPARRPLLAPRLGLIEIKPSAHHDDHLLGDPRRRRQFPCCRRRPPHPAAPRHAARGKSTANWAVG